MLVRSRRRMKVGHKGEKKKHIKIAEGNQGRNCGFV